MSEEIARAGADLAHIARLQDQLNYWRIQAQDVLAELHQAERELGAARTLTDVLNAQLGETGRCPICGATMDVYVAVFYHAEGCALNAYEQARKQNEQASRTER